MNTGLYRGEDCPCPSDCQRRGDCKACIAFHRKRGEQTCCEILVERAGSGMKLPEGPIKSGREIRLLDYGPCAG